MSVDNCVVIRRNSNSNNDGHAAGTSFGLVWWYSALRCASGGSSSRYLLLPHLANELTLLWLLVAFSCFCQGRLLTEDEPLSCVMHGPRALVA